MTELPDYLRPLESVTYPFPEAAVREAMARREESTPHLLRALDWVVEKGEEVPEDFLLHEYALRILAAFREQRAHAPLLLLARHPSVDDLLGDTISIDLGPALASTCGGDTVAIRQLIEDENVNEFVRAAGLRALGALCRAGEMPREALSDYLGGLFKTHLTDHRDFFGTALADIVAQFGFTEHLEKVRKAWNDGFVDPMYDDWALIEKQLKSGSFDESEERHWRLIEDPVETMSYWICFDSESDRGEEEEFEDDDEEGELSDEDEYVPSWDEELERLGPPSVSPPVVIAPKTGRNEPCPCGSGKKFKKCCG